MLSSDPGRPMPPAAVVLGHLALPEFAARASAAVSGHPGTGNRVPDVCGALGRGDLGGID
ncbi:hypothetical protein BZL30_9400 [Mycobacterium kansasii]|uniref:Uncharacterized protein n=1 Tax=Mycobacterium kansasii TaxID=1768 RepID=A0A1V3W9Y3_MYCKA|nr:hypothetical protein BZL30_9400 [Mycobacterium kansasii]